MDSFSGILDGITIKPIWIILISVAAGIIVREKFPVIGNWIPKFFKPQPTTDDMVDSIVDKVVDKLKK